MVEGRFQTYNPKLQYNNVINLESKYTPKNFVASPFLMSMPLIIINVYGEYCFSIFLLKYNKVYFGNVN